MPKKTVLSCALATTMWAWAVVALAQTSQDDTTSLDTIVVTAERRAERLQDVPITIANLDADVLERADAKSLGDIQALVPGFRLDVHSDINQPTIRGISTSITCAGCGNNVGIYVDGFYVPNPFTLDFQLPSVDSIQVLKGPQGTLFGRNTVAGAVQVNTAKPSTDSRAVVQASYGSYNAQNYQLYATTGLSSNVAVDITGAFSKGDGWVTNIADGNKDYGQYQNEMFRAGIKADLTDTLSLLFRYTHEDINDPSGTLEVPYIMNGQPLAYGAYQPGAVVATARGQVSSDVQIAMHSNVNGYQLTGTWALGFGTLTSYTQYRQDRTPYLLNSFDFVNIPILRLTTPDRMNTFSQELLLTSLPGQPLQWTAGSFYYHSSDVYPNIQETLFGGPFRLVGANGADDESIAAYGDATYEAVSNLFMTAGVRYTHDDVKDAFFRTTAGETSLPTLSSSRVTPRAVIRYALNSSSSTYVSFSRGYKAPVYNTGAFLNDAVKAEGLSAYEIGYKYASPGVSLDLSSFYYDYTNEQLASLQILNGAATSLVTNAASSHIYGVDGDARLDVSRYFEVTAGLEWLHARYENFPDAPGYVFGASHLLVSKSVDASGYAMPRAPDFTANIGGVYTVDVVKGKLALSGNVYYSSKVYFDPVQLAYQNHYTTLQLRAEWTDPSDRYSFAISGNNVTDTKYYTAVAESAFGAGATWGAPATIEGSVRIKFH
jgi:iron complex outermembrane receptor protein